MLRIGDIENSFADEKGEFTEGNPLNSIPATIAKAKWFNTVQREMAAIVENLSDGSLNSNCDTQIYDVLNRATPLRTSRIPVKRIANGFDCYPNIETEDHVLALRQTENGEIIIAENQSFIWKGLWRVTTEGYSQGERTFKLEASKTYHVRWRLQTGFSLENLEDKNYNPNSCLQEDNIFDTTTNDMLIALIVVDVNHRISITAYQNQFRLTKLLDITSTSTVYAAPGEQGISAYKPTHIIPCHWARTPSVGLRGISNLNLGYYFRTDPDLIDNTYVLIPSRNELKFYDYQGSGKTTPITWHFCLSA